MKDMEDGSKGGCNEVRTYQRIHGLNDRKLRSQKIHELNDGELRSYRRMILLRRARRSKVMPFLLGLWAALCILLVCLLFANPVRTSASDGFKYYTSVTIEAGDTLWSLADDYIDYGHYRNKAVYLAEIRSINHLDEHSIITPGQLLIIPYYSNVFLR